MCIRDRPIKVRGYAKTGMHRRINVENDVTFYTEYENGASGVFVTSTHDYPEMCIRDRGRCCWFRART